ncbi:MAG: hypothetical protein K8S62_05835 [Candidatus Sabulitectum sp.]|nr:hypothetical protein [Candidatus Sabulitectum sp.]
MKKALLIILLASVFAGMAFAEDEERTPTVTITLTENQVAILARAPEEEVTIELTEDQISIIVHNFPRVEISELTITTDHLGRDDTVVLEAEGRTGINPVPTP